MRRKLFTVLALVVALFSTATVVQAGRPDHSMGAVFNDLGDVVGIGFFMTDDSACFASWDMGDIHDPNDFFRINPDETGMRKINEREVEIHLYVPGQEFPFVGTGHLNSNWIVERVDGIPHYYGVYMNVRGEVVIDSETKNVQCIFVIDEDTAETTGRITVH